MATRQDLAWHSGAMAEAVDAADPIAELRMSAKAAVREKRWPQAVECWRSILEICASEDVSETRFQLAKAYRRMGSVQEAEDELTSLLKSNPAEVEVRWVAEYARIAMKRRDWREALARWRAVHKIYGRRMPPGGYAQMARCQVWLCDEAGAERTIARGLRIHPRHSEILLEWCAVAVARWELGEALRRIAHASKRLMPLPDAFRELHEQVQLAFAWRDLLPAESSLLSLDTSDVSDPISRVPPIVLVTHRPVDYFRSPCGSVYQLFVHPEHRIAEPLAHINVSAEKHPEKRLSELSGHRFSLFFNGLSALSYQASVQLLEEALRNKLEVFVYWHETSWSIRGALSRHHSSFRRVVPLLQAVRATHLVVTSQGVHTLVSLFGFPFERIRIVHEVVDLSRFRPAQRPVRSQNVPVVVGAGSELRSIRKGADTFSVVAQLVRQSMDPPPAFRWYLSSPPVRPTPPVPYPDAVDWRGHCDEFETALCEADCFILTSRDDPAARVVLEALSSGIPTLTFASTGFVELLPESMVCNCYEDMARRLVRILQGEKEAPEVYRGIAERFSAGNWVRRAFGPRQAAIAPVPDADLANLSRSYLLKQKERLATLEQLSLYPHDLASALEHAKNATDEQNWPEAIDRWSRLLERDDWTPTPAAYLSLAAAYRKQGALGDADKVATRGWRSYPEDLELAIAWAQAGMFLNDWREAATRWRTILDVFGVRAAKPAYAMLSRVSRKLGDLVGAERAASHAHTSQHSRRLLVERAAVQVCRRDWAGAKTLFEEAYGQDLGIATDGFLLDALTRYAARCSDPQLVDVSFAQQHMLAYASRVYSASRVISDATDVRARHQYSAAVHAAKRSDTLFILGSGESILDLQDDQWDLVRAHNSIGFNNWLVHQFVPDMYMFEVKPDREVTQRMLHNLEVVRNEYRDIPILWKDCWSFDRGRLTSHAQLAELDIYFPFSVEIEAYTIREFTQNLAVSRTLRSLGGDACRAFILQKRASLLALVDFAIETGFKTVVLCGVDLYGSAYFWEVEGFANRRALILPERTTGSGPHRTNDAAFGELTVSSLLRAYRDHVMIPAGAQLYVGSVRSALYPTIPGFDWR